MNDGIPSTNFDCETVSGTSAIFASGTFADLSSTATTLTAATITTATVENAVVGADIEFAPGSPYNEGITFKGWKAEAVITGGMWVIGSKGVLKPENVQAPFGVAKATVASGATCEVLVNGPVYMTAQANIGAGEMVAVGSAAVMNLCTPAGAGSSHVGKCITGAASGGKALIWLM